MGLERARAMAVLLSDVERFLCMGSTPAPALWLAPRGLQGRVANSRRLGFTTRNVASLGVGALTISFE